MRTYRQGGFEIKVNHAFEEVMWACADREETWVKKDSSRLDSRHNEYGVAHSVETYYEGKLVGGLYGVSIGGAFMGESMFHRMTDASKVALVFLVERMKERGFILLDTQYTNKHLATFNARNISKDEYLTRLNAALALDCRFD